MYSRPNVWQDTVDDPRGRIESICDETVGEITRIFSKGGSVRSNHYHKTDWHVLYVTSGKMILYERPAESKDMPTMTVVESGMYAYTPPMTEHTTAFVSDTTLLCFSRNKRGKADYDNDTVRCENLRELMNKS
jgi:oxalate decarboxylase/phosphoglucose isomerase-like protein (cupin superfamily)